MDARDIAAMMPQCKTLEDTWQVMRKTIFKDVDDPEVVRTLRSVYFAGAAAIIALVKQAHKDQVPGVGKALAKEISQMVDGLGES